MKNFTLALNIFLVAAVAVLFYLHFTANTNCSHPPKNLPAKTGFKIAYFEMDSIQNHYEYYKQVAKELGISEQAKLAELTAKKNALYSKAKKYQEKAASMTQADLQKAQQDMAESEKEYQAFEGSKGQELQDEKFKKLQDVKKKIEEYLKEFSTKNGYSFVFANNTNASEMYYKDTIYNITDQLVKGLNDLHKKKK